MMRVASLLAALAAPASAQSLCDDLDTFDGEVLELGQGQAECRTSLALGGAGSTHCLLEYPYRSDEATQTFDALLIEMNACIGAGATITQDQSVNHPDAYDLWTFEDGARSYAVSIKDKGALQQTLVFVRVSRP
jgi:hypothetical protein